MVVDTHEARRVGPVDAVAPEELTPFHVQEHVVFAHLTQCPKRMRQTITREIAEKELGKEMSFQTTYMKIPEKTITDGKHTITADGGDYLKKWNAEESLDDHYYRTLL